MSLPSRIVARAAPRHFHTFLLGSKRVVANPFAHVPGSAPTVSVTSSSLLENSYSRFFSEETKKTEAADVPPEEEEVVDVPPEESVPDETEKSPEKQLMDLKYEVERMKDKWVRSLAEQENIRGISKREVQAARDFAVTSFAKSLLDTADNLERALAAVPEEMIADKESNPVLATLYEGIQMTETGLIKSFEKNGLTKYGEKGDKFDPTEHDALFEYVDGEQEVGTIGQVMKSGFVLNGRVIRPAEVGVIKKA